MLQPGRQAPHRRVWRGGLSAWIAWGLAPSGFAFLAVAMERHTTVVLERDIKPLSRALSQDAGVAWLASALAESWARWSRPSP